MAGEAKITRSTTVQGGGLSVGGVQETLLSDSVKTFSKEFPANLTDGRVVFPIDVSEVKAMAIIANKDCTIETNATDASGGETLLLKANKALNWVLGDLAANKFLTIDVTDLYVTTGAESTVLKLIVGQDSTPALTD